MATYAIGDLQGCLAEFEQLLASFEFNEQEDRLWLVGDLINRGPASLEVLRRVHSMRTSCSVVLGNHDLHFLAIYFGGHRAQHSDTFDDLLKAPDVEPLAQWLRTLPLLHVDKQLGFCMAHAGVPHIWSLAQAVALAAEVEGQLSGEHYVDYFKRMYGNKPALWSNGLTDMDRWRSITNYFTRMRLVQADGTMDFAHKGSLDQAPRDWSAWYSYDNPGLQGLRIVFGHWAAIEGHTGRDDRLALDTGCVWGRALTAVCLESGQCFQVNAQSA